MASNTIISICFLVFMAFVAGTKAGGPIDIKTKGAVGDGTTDDAPAMMTAWKEACQCTEPGQVIIPPGDYMFATPVLLDGPCKAPIEVQAEGATIKAPCDPTAIKDDGWIKFKSVDKLTFCGGIFDGQGEQAWTTNKAAETGKCSLPYNFRFDFVKDSTIRGITSVNSKHFHINLIGCDNTVLEGVKIEAPAESLNTDGIHIGRTCGLKIIDATIKTGDDCISIGDGSKNIHIEKVTCGPGHGISIGSLGKYPNEEPVDGITVKDAKITGADNGLRIKTWPGSPPGTACNMHFSEVCMDNVANPILIDQEYCPHAKCHPETNCSNVKISDVSFKGIRGTSSTKAAIKLICSQGMPCEKVELSEIDLKYTGPEGGEAVSECKHVEPAVVGSVCPQPCTAPPSPPAGHGKHHGGGHHGGGSHHGGGHHGGGGGHHGGGGGGAA